MYKYNVIDILYKRICFTSAVCSLFSNCLLDHRVLSFELNGQGSRPARQFFSLVTFHLITFNLIIHVVFFVGG